MTERKASMGDKVYRGDVVKFIRNNISLGAFMKRTVKTADEACWDLCDKLNYVPAIEEKPEPHWIPVTERLPENGRQVLVYARSVHYALAKYDEMREADGTYKKQWVTFDAWKPFYTIKEVIAWCELPEPNKGVTT